MPIALIFLGFWENLIQVYNLSRFCMSYNFFYQWITILSIFSYFVFLICEKIRTIRSNLLIIKSDTINFLFKMGFFKINCKTFPCVFYLKPTFTGPSWANGRNEIEVFLHHESIYYPFLHIYSTFISIIISIHFDYVAYFFGFSYPLVPRIPGYMLYLFPKK